LTAWTSPTHTFRPAPPPPLAGIAREKARRAAERLRREQPDLYFRWSG
jgi:hypothetical protein